MAAVTTFASIWQLGYERLVPIIPPDATVSATSTLSRHIGKHNDPRGKAVGVKRGETWSGFDWINHEADERDCTRWQAMGAGIGIKTGQGLLAIDADTKDEAYAAIIRDIVREHCGETPIRVGNYPKALYLIACTDEYRYARVEFGDRLENGRLKDRVEILSDGRQFVAYGIHPNTQKPYHWPKPLIPRDRLNLLEPGQVDAMMAALQKALPSAPAIVREGAASGSTVNQEALKGSFEAVRRAVQATPNTSEHFPTRESYRDFGYAIKGALQDHPDAAFELFAEWCERWENDEGLTNDPDVVASDWRRMKPPYKSGAGKLYDICEKASGGRFTAVQAYFEPLPDDLNPFEEVRQAEARDAAPDPASLIKATPYGFPEPSTIPARRWLYGGHYIRQFVSLTVAPSGVGKSSLGIVEGLAMATGRALLGPKPEGQFKVWMWNGEDPIDELNRRIAGAMLFYGVTAADVGDRLFVDSGRDMKIILATETRDGVKIAVPVVEAVERTIRGNGIDVLMVDPFVASHRVSENDNNSIEMVAKQWAEIADRCNCSIELVHHSRKLNGAEITVEASRGGGALVAAARSKRALTGMTEKEAQRLGIGEHRRYFRFGDAVNNLMPPMGDKTEWMERKSVALGNVEAGIAGSRGDYVGVVAAFDLGSVVPAVELDARSRILHRIRNGSWKKNVQAGAMWVGIVIGEEMDLDPSDASERGQINNILNSLIKEGVLRTVDRMDQNRNMRPFVEVVDHEDNLSSDLFG